MKFLMDKDVLDVGHNLDYGITFKLVDGKLKAVNNYNRMWPTP